MYFFIHVQFLAVRRYPRPPFHVVDMKIASAVSPSSEASNATFLLGRVDFQKVKYDLLSVSGQLELQRVSYPSAGKLDSFLKWTGMGLQHSDSGNKESVDAVKAAQEHWGCNEYDIPLPQFLDLYLVSNFNDSFTSCPSFHSLWCRAT